MSQDASAGRTDRRPGIPRSGGWRPWHGRPRARDVLCVLAITVSAVYAVAAIPLTPALISSHPVLLELLTGSTSSIISAGAYADVDTKLQLALVVVAAVPGIMRFDWVYWWAGKLWGHRIVERLGDRAEPREVPGRWIEAENAVRRCAGGIEAPCDHDSGPGADSNGSLNGRGQLVARTPALDR